MKIKNNHIRIASDNNHLLDIFADNYYLELGNIAINIMNRILNEHIVKVEDIADFNNQNHGVGASSINHDVFRTIFPYIFIDNINRKDESLQIFITYGLALYTDEEKKQRFAPIVLIPVNIFLEDGACLFQIAAKPTSNPIFIEYLRQKGYAVNEFGNDTNIYNIEKYCFSFARYDGIEVKTDNYLTFVRTNQPQAVLVHEKFSLKNQFIKPLGNKAYIDESNRIYNITTLDNRQRLAVQRASLGNSFGIIGYLGTGKTTSLINIASDSIARDKKVLYVSNVKETLQKVEKTFNSHYLLGLLMDLTKSPRGMTLGSSLIEKNLSEEINEEDIINELTSNYKIIDDYEMNLSKRIYNFRFIDVLKEMIEVKKPEVDYSIDSLDGIYKHEYHEIAGALEAIDSKMKKIEIFNNSKFINIPINHHIKYPNQIMTLLFQLHKSFKDLKTHRDNLMNQYGFKEIKNYAMFKNVINNIGGFVTDKMPEPWKQDDLIHFKKAVEIYPDIKRLVYSIQEMELYINWDYQNYDNFDINDAISKIINPYFTVDQKDKINYVLENLQQINAKLHVGKYSSDHYLEQLTRVKNIVDWDFSQDDEIEFIIKLIQFLNNNYIYNKWFDRSKYSNIRKQIIKTRNHLETYESLKESLKSIFGDLSSIEQHIDLVTRFIQTKKIPKRFMDFNVEELLANLNKYRELNIEIRKIKYDYYTLTGRDYSSSDDMVLALDTWNNFLKAIPNKNYENSLIKFLSHINIEYYENILSDLNKLLRVYNSTNKIYKYISDITGVKDQVNNINRVTKINEFVEYIKVVTEIDGKMKEIVKEKLSFINIDAYLQLQTKINQLIETKKKIVGNIEYSYLYGSFFEDDKTNVNEIANYIKNFELYIDCFVHENEVIKSLKQDKFIQIQDIINASQTTIYEINESFKLYNKIFKDGVGDYYYDDIDDNIKHLDELLNAKEELIIYLDITDKLKVLLKYKLFILNNLITNNKIDNTVNLFKYKYFHNIYHIYMVDHNFLESDQLDKTLNEIIKGENDIIKLNIKYLQNLKAAKAIHTKQKKISFRDFVRRSSKSLFLATTKVLNNNLDIKEFDLVIIDDAQVLHANEYWKAIKAKQVIIAGDNISGATIFSNLISRMRNNNMMNFRYRYDVAPLSLIENLPNTFGQFYPEVKLNSGIEITTKSEVVTISELFLENEDYIINYYTQSLIKKKMITEGIVNYLFANKMNENIIYDIIRNRFNTLDFNWYYSQDSDINVINANEIFELPNEKLVENIFRNVLLAKYKVVIIDKENALSNGNHKNNIFFAKVFKEPLYEFNPVISPILQKLAFDLSKTGAKVSGSYGEISIVLEVEGLFYGIMFYLDPDKSDFDILEDYRRYYVNSMNHHFEIINIWILDLVNKYEDVLKKIGETINNEYE